MRNGDESAGQAMPAGGTAAALPIEFRGKATEYFGIWIVNLALTVITIGVFSAWAKVRRKRYFLGNTYIDGHAFDYHAKGKQLLIGRVLVVAVLVGQSFIEEISPFVAFGTLLVIIFVLLPWVINRSLSFNARMTSWRNVRFNFRPSFWGALGTMILMPAVGVLTLGLLMPVATGMGANYIVRRHSFGTASFDSNPSLGDYYLAGLQAVGAGIVVLVVLYPIAHFGTMLMIPEVDPTDMQLVGLLAGNLLPILIAIAVLIVIEFYGALSRKIIVNAIALSGGHRFRATITGTEYTWIRVSNAIVQTVTLFLMRPWAAVRDWRYNCNHIKVLPAGDLGGFVDSARPAGGAFGSEYVDVVGFDFGL